MWSRRLTQHLEERHCGVETKGCVSPSKTRLAERETRNSAVGSHTLEEEPHWEASGKKSPGRRGLGIEGTGVWAEGQNGQSPPDASSFNHRPAEWQRRGVQEVDAFSSQLSFTKIWRHSHSDLGEMDQYRRWRGRQHKAAGGGEPVRPCGEEGELWDLEQAHLSIPECQSCYGGTNVTAWAFHED